MAGRNSCLFLSAGPLARLALLALLFLQSGCSSLFFYPNDITYVTPDRLNLEFEDVYLNTPHGETLHGWWLPASGDQDVSGTVYYLHGNAQNVSAHLLNVAWLPEKGYNVFTLDYRGYGQSSGQPDIAGALQDVESGMRWMARDSVNNNQPIYLLGQSLGGALGVAFASEWARHGELPAFSGVIVDSSFSGFRAIAREKLGDFWLTWPLQMPLSLTITGEYEGLERIADIAPVPVMVIHSERDRIIPFHHGLQLYRSASQPKVLLETDTPHAATFTIPAYREAVLSFMDDISETKQR